MKAKAESFPMNFSSKNLPEYLPLNDLVTPSRGQVVRVIPEVRGRRKGGEREEKGEIFVNKGR